MDFQENFLQTVWKYQYFDKNSLNTTDGSALSILKIGYHNFHEGPDFLEAQIQIGEMKYFGHVEVHRKSSDWKNHEHDVDPRYNSVILHVVWEDDRPILRNDGTVIPTLVLKGKILLDVVRNYERLVNGKGALICASGLGEIPDIIRFSSLEKSLVERLEGKAKLIFKLLDDTNKDWEETCFRWLMSAFGFKTNSETMLRLSEKIQFKTLKKHSGNTVIIQALLLGQAGMIPNQQRDDYGDVLFREYDFYQKKYGLLLPVYFSEWKFMGVRPGNFPSLRLVQLAEIISKNPSLLSTVLNDARNFGEFKKVFDIKVPEYWQHHYQINKPTIKRLSRSLSAQTLNLLMINFVVPLWFAYGKYIQDSSWQEKCFDLLQEIDSEENFIIRKFRECDWKASNAFESQGMIGQFQNYCNQKKCLDCKIGQNLLKPIRK
ncbi:DUF2851 family protein [Belliella sp. DSM 107340]|uniref:DUF2851 family protein n=1 Tax=Belliella calami TaxID=2923436 RepID=A0ABS9ULS1_9BACT|nr:DUF2851 family protein [Belliella calami]MCH7397574.1 DUF2851 family protein [Belliella calami]